MANVKNPHPPIIGQDMANVKHPHPPIIGQGTANVKNPHPPIIGQGMANVKNPHPPIIGQGMANVSKTRISSTTTKPKWCSGNWVDINLGEFNVFLFCSSFFVLNPFACFSNQLNWLLYSYTELEHFWGARHYHLAFGSNAGNLHFDCMWTKQFPARRGIVNRKSTRIPPACNL